MKRNPVPVGRSSLFAHLTYSLCLHTAALSLIVFLPVFGGGSGAPAVGEYIVTLADSVDISAALPYGHRTGGRPAGEPVKHEHVRTDTGNGEKVASAGNAAARNKKNPEEDIQSIPRGEGEDQPEDMSEERAIGTAGTTETQETDSEEVMVGGADGDTGENFGEAVKENNGKKDSVAHEVQLRKEVDDAGLQRTTATASVKPSTAPVTSDTPSPSKKREVYSASRDLTNAEQRGDKRGNHIEVAESGSTDDFLSRSTAEFFPSNVSSQLTALNGAKQVLKAETLARSKIAASPQPTGTATAIESPPSPSPPMPEKPVTESDVPEVSSDLRPELFAAVPIPFIPAETGVPDSGHTSAQEKERQPAPNEIQKRSKEATPVGGLHKNIVSIPPGNSHEAESPPAPSKADKPVVLPAGKDGHDGHQNLFHQPAGSNKTGSSSVNVGNDSPDTKGKAVASKTLPSGKKAGSSLTKRSVSAFNGNMQTGKQVTTGKGAGSQSEKPSAGKAKGQGKGVNDGSSGNGGVAGSGGSPEGMKATGASENGHAGEASTTGHGKGYHFSAPSLSSKFGLLDGIGNAFGRPVVLTQSEGPSGRNTAAMNEKNDGEKAPTVGIEVPDALLPQDIEIKVIAEKEILADIFMSLSGRSHPSNRKRHGEDRERKMEEAGIRAGKGTSPSSEAKILALRTAGKGIYIFSVTNSRGKESAVAIAFHLHARTDNERIKEYKSISLTPGTVRKFIFLMPEALFWDDDDRFSGIIEDSRSVTKFVYETGLVWKEEKE